MIRTLSAAAMAVVLTYAPAAAQSRAPDVAQDSVVVGAGEASGNGGRLAVNIVAGSSNQQAGAVTIAIGDVADQSTAVRQVILSGDRTDRTTGISIGPQAFSDNGGMVSINLTAGDQNQSANVAALAIGNHGAVSDLMLSQARAPTAPAGASARGLDPSNDSVFVDDTALAGNTGLVQMNLIGGERNSSANAFALNVSAGGNP